MLNKIFQSAPVVYHTYDSYNWHPVEGALGLGNINYHNNIDPYVENIAPGAEGAATLGLFQQDIPTANSPSRIYAVVALATSYYPSWRYTAYQWDTVTGTFLGECTTPEGQPLSPFSGVNASGVVACIKSRLGHLYWVRNYAGEADLNSFSISDFVVQSTLNCSAKYTGLTTLSSPQVDESSDTLLNADSRYLKGYPWQAGGAAKFSWYIGGRAAATALEEFGRVWVLLENRTLLLLDYLKKQVLGKVKIPTPLGGSALITGGNVAALWWDTQYKRLLIFERVANNPDGSCASLVYGFRMVPLATRLTTPIPLRWPRAGRTIPVLIQSVGDLNEGVAGGVIQTTVTGDAELRNIPTTDNNGRALAQVECLSEGDFTISCQLAVADSNVPVNNPDVDGGGGGGVTPVTPPLNPLPTIDFSVVPSSMESGSSATLAWATVNATSVSIDNGIGAVATSGTQSVSPTTTTTYKITATGAGGTTTKTVTLTIVAPPDGGGGGTPVTVTTSHLFVSPSGNDSNDGSQLHPFKTIQKAANIVLPDTTVHVLNGTYAESVLLGRGGSSASKRVVFKAENKWGALLRSPNWYNWNIKDGVGYLDFVDFAMTSPKRDGVTHGIIIYGHHCRAIGNHIYGLLTTGSNSECTGIVLGVFTTAAATAARQYNEAWGNLIHDIGSDQAPTTSRRGQGIYVTAKNCHAYNNVIYNFYRCGIHVNHQCGNNNVVNNTIAKGPCPTMGALLMGGGGTGESVLVDYVVIANNMVLDCEKAIEIYCGSGSSYGTHNVMTNNLGYGNGQNFWSAQQFGTPISNQNFYSSDPLVVSRSIPNYDLGGGSPASGHGSHTYAPATDYTNATRPNPPSIGAYE